MRRGPLLGSFSAIVLLVAATLASPAPAAADQIAYNCGEDICLINPDNLAEHSNLTETATSSGREKFPVWSPDGSRIAYSGQYITTGFETYHVYTLDPAEAAPREATDVSQDEERGSGPPVWSPDGTRLAWTSQATSSANPVQTGIFAGLASGASEPWQVGAKEGSHPTWSADGAKIAFGAGLEGIYLAAADGSGGATFLPGGVGLEPNWSPDGRFIAANRWNSYPYHVRIVNADGSGGFHEMAKISDLATEIDWSSDSARVVYVADEEPNLDQVWVAPADGSSPGVQIPLPSGWVVPHNPRFSPDGTRVAFDARPEASGNRQVFVAPADGSAPAVPITNSKTENEQPDWKPGPGGPKPPGGPGGGQPPTGEGSQPPLKVKLAYFRHPRIVGGGDFLVPVAINCFAEGGHPTGKVAEICAASGNAYAQGVAPGGLRPWAKPKARKVLFAKGSVKVPAGKSKPLKLKITAAGKKLLKRGKPLKLRVSVAVKSGAAKPTRSTKIVTIR